MEQDRAASIEARAYHLWEESGRENGNHERHWQQAEQDIDASEPTAAAPPSPAGDAASSSADDHADESPILDGQAKKLRRMPSPIVQP